MNNRNTMIDIAKGIVIILMVVGHCYSNDNMLLQLIYAFHMPFFFIVSGAMTRANDTNKIKFTSLKTTFIPYVCFSLLYGLLINIMGFFSGNSSFLKPLLKDFVAIITLRGLSVMWFVPCLFFAKYLAIKLGNSKKVCRGGVIGFGVMLLGLGINMPEALSVIRRIMVGTGFVTIGYYGYKCFLTEIKKERSWNKVIPCLVLFLISANCNGKVDMFKNHYSNIILYLTSSITGSLIVLKVASCIDKIDCRIKIFLKYIGQNTLIILGTHKLIIEVIRYVDGKFMAHMLPRLSFAEGIVFSIIVLIIEIPVIKIINYYFTWILGRKKMEERIVHAK